MTHLCLMMANAASGHDRERAKRAASTYAASLAWTEADVDIQEIPPGFRLLDEDGAPAVFKTQLSSLGAGDDLLVTSLASISINPHHIQKFIDTLLGKGANLHTLPTGNVLNHVIGLRAGLDLAKHWFSRVEKTEREADERGAQAWAEATEFRREYSAALVRRFGIPQEGLPSVRELLGEDPRPRPPKMKPLSSEPLRNARALLHSALMPRRAIH